MFLFFQVIGMLFSIPFSFEAARRDILGVGMVGEFWAGILAGMCVILTDVSWAACTWGHVKWFTRPLQRFVSFVASWAYCYVIVANIIKMLSGINLVPWFLDASTEHVVTIMAAASLFLWHFLYTVDPYIAALKKVLKALGKFDSEQLKIFREEAKELAKAIRLQLKTPAVKALRDEAARRMAEQFVRDMAPPASADPSSQPTPTPTPAPGVPLSFGARAGSGGPTTTTTQP
jgi:hypothetical protein